ncbi:pseudouridine synthase [Pseudoscardovia radai]|uniref:pseudouridine synthase n=1 Tax=Pseudoscardovia radai TaxID=987066 RepID=UPI00399527AC
MVSEPDVPDDIGILYEDADIVVLDKPHLLPTMPRGMWYRHTALMRLREMYGDDAIVPAHRLDRATAGVVVFVRTPALRGAFQTLFQERRVHKVYECIAPCAPVRLQRRGAVGGVREATESGRSTMTPPRRGGFAHEPVLPPVRDIVAQARRVPLIADIPGVRLGPVGIVTPLDPPRAFPLMRRSHITKLRGVLQAFEEPGETNAVSVIGLCDDQTAVRRRDETGERVALAPLGLRAYRLEPRTGKTHQLRVHMAALGLPILGDDMYPRVLDSGRGDLDDSAAPPLQLVARELRFSDPRDGTPRVFRSRIPLAV